MLAYNFLYCNYDAQRDRANEIREVLIRASARMCKVEVILRKRMLAYNFLYCNYDTQRDRANEIREVLIRASARMCKVEVK